MLSHDLRHTLRRGWINVKNAAMAGLVVTLIASVIIGITALIPIILAVVFSIIMVITYRVLYEKYSQSKRGSIKSTSQEKKK